MNKKKKIIVAVAFIVLYVLILHFMVVAEADAPTRNIKSVGDAFWFSLVTLTTVGYGDYYPVTLSGKLLGFVFMLLSAGFFGFTISVFVTSFSKIFIPNQILRSAQNKNWYIFSSVNENALNLSESILKKDKLALVLFLENKNQETLNYVLSSNAVFLEISIDDALKFRKHGKGKKTYLFFIGDNGYSNYQKALTYKDNPIIIYCETSMYVDNNPANIHMFSEYTNLGRFLWANYPLKKDEKNIVIVGCEQYGSEIIEQAFIVNVDNELGKRSYHIFGNVNEFLNLHTELDKCFAVGKEEPGKDSLYFYRKPISAHLSILTNADRIILCYDNDEDNFKAYSDICRYVAYAGKIFIREKIGIHIYDNRIISFGSNQDISDYDTIMLDRLTQRAKSMHQTYCDNNPKQAVEWEKLTEFTRNSNYAVADHLRTKIRILLDDDDAILNQENLAKAKIQYENTRVEKAEYYRRIEHERWMRFHIINNWTYSAVRNNAKRQHNTILPFEELTLEQQAMDDYGWEIF